MIRSRTRILDSLETRLPVVMAGVVAVLLLTALAVTYYEMRSSALEAGAQRLTGVSQQLAGIIEAASVPRAQQMMAVGGDPRITSLLRGLSEDDQAAAEALDRLRLAGDSGAAILLLDASGAVLTGTGSVLPRSELPVAPPVLPLDAREVAYSPLHVAAGTPLYWMVAPVRQGGVLGYIAQQRRFGNRAAENIEQLIGQHIEIFLTSGNGGPWVGIDGTVGLASALPDVAGVSQYLSPHGIEHQAVATSLHNDWRLIATMPVEQSLVRTREVMRRLSWFGLTLLLIGVAAAWLVSRSVTAPLQRLGAAADAIASGDYARRTGVDRADELGRLALSFDGMARQVEASHQQLEQRFAEAQRLAAELEAANQRLQEAFAEVEVARGEAQQASRAKSEFLAMISHEIRTPINAMVGYTDLMEMGLGGELSQQHREYVERIRLSGAHLTALVNDVLDFAKIESGQMRVLREVRSAPAAIHAAVNMLQARAHARSIRLRVDCSMESVFLGDGQRAEQILINLLANAIKFTPEHGVINVACQRRVSHAHAASGEQDVHEWTCITVHDSGPGVPSNQFEAIFEPFVQGTPGYTRPHGGTGLGLAISRSLARMMGGDISVESPPGDGACFTLWLPHPAGAAARV